MENLKIALGVNSFVFNGELRLNVPSLLERALPPCDNRDIKNRRKKVKKFGQPWLILTVQYLVLSVAILRACRAKELPISLTLFFYCSPMKIRPGQAAKKEKATSLYRLRQSKIAEKMKRCVP